MSQTNSTFNSNLFTNRGVTHIGINKQNLVT